MYKYAQKNFLNQTQVSSVRLRLASKRVPHYAINPASKMKFYFSSYARLKV